GLICAPIEEERANSLNLQMMVSDNTSLHETAFTVSIDLIGKGCTTGISAHDRAKTVKALVDENATSTDFARPGHIFPLKAMSGGVLRRTGHTEAAIDLARLAGFYPAGVLVEILNEDGTMARLPHLMRIAEKHGLKVISIKDLVAYRMDNERIVEKEAKVSIQSKYGPFDLTIYNQLNTGDQHLVISKGEFKGEEPTLVRVHSNSETGDILGMLFDDYGRQIQRTLQMIQENGSGALLFIRNRDDEQLIQKLHSLADNQDESDPRKIQRDIGVGAQILNDLGIRKIRLITNHPKKRIGLMGYGLEIIENIRVVLD
ncbi:MAG: 3,4-dihydroxy-2-butanone-4-phosphate synthase, partial [Bacteroidia bacterium]|nr:3,4-dihydroxy-2-butanone-4-phosphate synthase [Bacteroidia bacterium]